MKCIDYILRFRHKLCIKSMYVFTLKTYTLDEFVKMDHCPTY